MGFSLHTTSQRKAKVVFVEAAVERTLFSQVHLEDHRPPSRALQKTLLQLIVLFSVNRGFVQGDFTCTCQILLSLGGQRQLPEGIM